MDRFSHLLGGMNEPYELDGTGAIEPELLLQKLRSDCELVIVDVRTTAEFHGGHIPGSRFIPLHQFVARACEIATHRAETIVLVSRGGTRARIAAGALRLAGFDEVVILEGGIRRWRELGYPIEDLSTIGRGGEWSQPTKPT